MEEVKVAINTAWLCIRYIRYRKLGVCERVVMVAIMVLVGPKSDEIEMGIIQLEQ